MTEEKRAASKAEKTLIACTAVVVGTIVVLGLWGTLKGGRSERTEPPANVCCCETRGSSPGDLHFDWRDREACADRDAAPGRCVEDRETIAKCGPYRPPG